MGVGREQSRIQVAGWLLWRGGLWFSAAAAVYYAVWWWVREVRLPSALKLGVALAVLGVLLVMISLILERIHDARAEGDLVN